MVIHQDWIGLVFLFRLSPPFLRSGRVDRLIKIPSLTLLLRSDLLRRLSFLSMPPIPVFCGAAFLTSLLDDVMRFMIYPFSV